MDNPHVPPENALTDASHQGPPGSPTTCPVSATVFGVLNTIFGGIGLLCLPFVIFGMLSPGMLAPEEAPGVPNPVNAVLFVEPIYRAWAIISKVPGLFAPAVLLAAGIGLLMTQSWGRSLSIGYAWYIILMSVMALLMGAIFVFGPLWRLYQNPPFPESKMIALFGLISSAVRPLLELIYSILMLFFLTRPAVAKAYRTQDFETCSIL